MADYKPAKIAYKLFEPAGGAENSLCPVIFLHGMSMTKSCWLDMPQVIANQTKRTAYALDARNHGDSEYNDVFDFDANAIDLIHFMDTMNISKAALVGQSMGGITAMKVAMKEPEKVEMFFSVDIHPNKSPKEIPFLVLKTHEAIYAAIKEVPSGLPEKDAIKFALDLAEAKVEKELKLKLTVPKENFLNGRLKLRPKPDGTYDNYYNNDAITALLENPEKLNKALSGQYNGPAFFLWGNASPFNVINEEAYIKELFPKAELIEFDGAGHDVVGDCWEKFTQTVLAGLKNEL